MKNILNVVLVILLYTNTSVAQSKIDRTWVLGHRQGAVISFLEDSINVSNVSSDLLMNAASASISDTDGDLLFYSNGCHIYNKEYDIMQDGDSLSNLGPLHNLFCGVQGSPFHQSALILPRPNHACEYFVLHHDHLWGNTPEANIYTSRVDMRYNNGLGAVLEKNEVIYSDSLTFYGMTTTLHANGEDWWVVVPRMLSNCYFVLLLTEDGLEYVDTQCLGGEIDWARIGQAVFSPNGKRYARIEFMNAIDIFDFDTETGQFSNDVHIPLDFVLDDVYTGVSISPNSRYLYTTTPDAVNQFDLEADSIAGSRILIDTLLRPDSIDLAVRFNTAQLGPDDKIYIGGTIRWNHLHVIHEPDSAGIACNLEQYALRIDTIPGRSAFGMPNIPYFPDSYEALSCDTVFTTSTQDLIDLAGKIDVQVYPNPNAGNELRIEVSSLQGEGVFVLLDIIGNRQKEIAISSTNQVLDISDVPSGMYVYQFLVKDKIIASGKFVRAKN